MCKIMLLTLKKGFNLNNKIKFKPKIYSINSFCSLTGLVRMSVMTQYLDQR